MEVRNVAQSSHPMSQVYVYESSSGVLVCAVSTWPCKVCILVYGVELCAVCSIYMERDDQLLRLGGSWSPRSYALTASAANGAPPRLLISWRHDVQRDDTSSEVWCEAWRDSRFLEQTPELRP